MTPKWKVRVMLPSKELGEVEFEGSLSDLEKHMAKTAPDLPIMVVQRVIPPAVQRLVAVMAAEEAKGAAEDAAKGGDSIAVQKK